MTTPNQKRTADYTAHGTVIEMMRDTGHELVFSGPAGTGKTRGCLEKLDAINRYFPGCRTLLLRKTRSSLTQSSIVIYEREVLLGRFAEKPSNQHVYFHGTDMEYRYPNRSVMVTGGLDKSAKIMSSQYDAILVDEGTEITEDDHQDLTSRLRNGVVPFQQLLLACNPDSPVHYLKKRQKAGRLRMINAQHTDNPVLFDHALQQWTKRGEDYVIGILGNLTGPKRLRLRDGIWCMTSGMCFDGFQESVHLFWGWNEDNSLHRDDGKRYDGISSDYKTDPPKSWRRTLSIDFGFANPFVCQFWAEDEDGRLYMYREIYMSRRIVEDHAKDIIDVCNMYDEPAFADVIVDHDAEDRATLERHLRVNWRFAKLMTTPADKSKKAGMDAVQARLKVQPDGRARIFFRRECVVKRDDELDQKKKPTCTIDEIWGYVYDDKGEPVKEDDHGCDGTRYRVATDDLKPQHDYTQTSFRR